MRAINVRFSRRLHRAHFAGAVWTYGANYVHFHRDFFEDDYCHQTIYWVSAVLMLSARMRRLASVCSQDH